VATFIVGLARGRVDEAEQNALIAAAPELFIKMEWLVQMANQLHIQHGKRKTKTRKRRKMTDSPSVRKLRGFNPSRVSEHEPRAVASRAPCYCSTSASCIQWGESILREHGLSDWTVTWTPGGTEGIALFKTRNISIHWPEGNPDYALMLHEIAHAVCGRPGHDSEYAHQYMRLVREYFTPNAKADPQKRSEV